MTFYLYMYLDPRKPGQYCYNDVCFLYEPIYVGKGTGDRYLSHIKETFIWSYIKPSLKHHKIKKIADGGQLPFVNILTFGTAEEMLLLEENFINDIGRIITKTGPLCNVRNTTWERGELNSAKQRAGNGLAGRRFKTLIDPFTNEMMQVPIERVLVFTELGFVVSGLWKRPAKQNQMSRAGKTNPMYGKSAIKGRKWVTVLSTNKSELLTINEINLLNEEFTYGRNVCKNKRKRVILNGNVKSTYMSDEDIIALPNGTKYQLGIQWKNNKKTFTVGKENEL